MRSGSRAGGRRLRRGSNPTARRGAHPPDVYVGRSIGRTPVSVGNDAFNALAVCVRPRGHA
ncbi:hypothetical protein [Terrabacter sp. 2YAF2]|uniref:hypothetical protein n=1 Tax=Terrabacter sp. 2YAF2 TaxID=3233026 RepID=UPI003F970727